MSENELKYIIPMNIKRLMELYNLTQKDVAEYMGTTQATVSNWCNGVKLPRMDKIDKLCRLFRVDRDALMEYDSNGNAPIKEVVELMETARDLPPEKIRLLIAIAVEMGGKK